MLAVVRDDGTYLPTYDANGNVSEYVNASDGSVAAHYDYSPFGEILMQDGDLAGTFTHRFSTKPYCPITKQVEYQLRKYRPEVGRWMSRDPIGYFKTYAIYSFSCNRPDFFDVLGLSGEQCQQGEGEIRNVVVQRIEMPEIKIMNGLKMELVTTDFLAVLSGNIGDIIKGKAGKEIDSILGRPLFGTISNFAKYHKAAVSALFQTSGGSMIVPAVRYTANVSYDQRKCRGLFFTCYSWGDWIRKTEIVKLDWESEIFTPGSADYFFLDARDLFTKGSEGDFYGNYSGLSALINRIVDLIIEEANYSHDEAFIRKLLEDTKCKFVLKE